MFFSKKPSLCTKRLLGVYDKIHNVLRFQQHRFIFIYPDLSIATEIKHISRGYERRLIIGLL